LLNNKRLLVRKEPRQKHLTMRSQLRIKINRMKQTVEKL